MKHRTRRNSAHHDLAALTFQPEQAGEARNIAEEPTSVRRGKAKHILRRLVEARDREVAPQDDDRNFNGFENVDQIGRVRIYGRLVSVDRSKTSPAGGSSSHFRRYRKLCTARGSVGGRSRRPSAEIDAMPAATLGIAAC